MSDDAFYQKANAAVHIDELAQVSYGGRKTVEDHDGRHGEMASGGWNYRSAYFEDFNGEYYRLKISVAQNADGKMLYNIGQIKPVGKGKEEAHPKIEGSRANNDDDPRGFASSANSIRQGTEKSQEGGVKFSLATESDGEYLSLAEKYRDGTASEEETKRLQEMADAAAEAALSDYPTDYFRQLLYGNVQSIRVELVGNLAPKADAEPGETAAAFAQELPGEYLAVFDVHTLSAGNVYHEFTHVTDRRLAWDAAHREGALFSEEAWSALNPTGFAYAESYEDYPAELWQYNNSGCFVSEYSMTFPTEDRATMMEMAMTGDLLTQDYWAPLRKKLQYYSDCIRGCFNMENWQEPLPWETVLR